MKKIYKLYIGILLSIVTVSCVDTLDADKYFRDRKTMEDIFADKDSTEAWLAHAYSYLAGENMEVSTKENILWCFADDIYFGSGDDYKNSKPVRMMRTGVTLGEPVIRESGKRLFSYNTLI